MFLAIFSSSALADDTPPADQLPPARVPDDANRNIVLPTSPGDHKLKFRTHIGTRAVEMSYLLHFPPGYDTDGKKHPMLVFFHGIGECGSDLGGIYALGPMTLLREDSGNPVFAASCPFIVLCPQCPAHGETWDVDFMYKAAAQLVDQTVKKTHCDADRVYATGLSMGGLGSWCVAQQQPDLFAAISPLSSMEWQPGAAPQLLKYTSVWSIVGDQDEDRFVDGTKHMQAVLAKSPLPQRFTYLRGNGHDAWFPAYDNPQYYEWFLSHRRPDAMERKTLDSQPAPPANRPMPTTPGHYLLTYATKIGDQPIDLDYVLYLPRDYKPGAAPHPAMLFLHEQDTIGSEYKEICMHGPDLMLEKKPALQNNFPFVVISPRLPIKCDWQSPGMTPMLLSLIDHVSQSIAIDPDRISVTGLNAGAAGAWKIAGDVPDRFAAIIPVVVDGSLPDGGDRGKAVRAMPGRAFIKASDGGLITTVNQLIAGAKTDWRLAKLPESATALGDVPAYSDGPFLNWLAQQKRRPAAVSTAEK